MSTNIFQILNFSNSLLKEGVSVMWKRLKTEISQDDLSNAKKMWDVLSKNLSSKDKSAINPDLYLKKEGSNTPSEWYKILTSTYKEYTDSKEQKKRSGIEGKSWKNNRNIITLWENSEFIMLSFLKFSALKFFRDNCMVKCKDDHFTEDARIAPMEYFNSRDDSPEDCLKEFANEKFYMIPSWCISKQIAHWNSYGMNDQNSRARCIMLASKLHANWKFMFVLESNGKLKEVRDIWQSGDFNRVSQLISLATHKSYDDIWNIIQETSTNENILERIKKNKSEQKKFDDYLKALMDKDSVKAIKTLQKLENINETIEKVDATPLQYIFDEREYFNIDVFNFLIENGANIKKRNNKGLAPLNLLLRWQVRDESDATLVKHLFDKLISLGADVKTNTSNAVPPIFSLAETYYALENVKLELFKRLLEIHNNVTEIHDKLNLLQTVLEHRCEPEIVDLLIHAGADIKKQSYTRDEGMPPIMELIRTYTASSDDDFENFKKCIDIFIKNGANFNAEYYYFQDNCENALEFAASQNGGPDVFKALIRGGCTLKDKDRLNHLILKLKESMQYEEAIIYLGFNKMIDYQDWNDKKQTILMCALKSGDGNAAGLARTLFNASLDAEDVNGCNAVFYTMNNSGKISKNVLSDATPEQINHLNNQDSDAISYCVEHTSSVNLDTVDVLLEKGFHVRRQDVVYALDEYQDELFLKLLPRCQEITDRDFKYLKLRDKVSKKPAADAIFEFFGKKMEKYASDDLGTQLLALAASFGNYKIIKYLIENGADISYIGSMRDNIFADILMGYNSHRPSDYYRDFRVDYVKSIDYALSFGDKITSGAENYGRIIYYFLRNDMIQQARQYIDIYTKKAKDYEKDSCINYIIDYYMSASVNLRVPNKFHSLSREEQNNILEDEKLTKKASDEADNEVKQMLVDMLNIVGVSPFQWFDMNSTYRELLDRKERAVNSRTKKAAIDIFKIFIEYAINHKDKNLYENYSLGDIIEKWTYNITDCSYLLVDYYKNIVSDRKKLYNESQNYVLKKCRENYHRFTNSNDSVPINVYILNSIISHLDDKNILLQKILSNFDHYKDMYLGGFASMIELFDQSGYNIFIKDEAHRNIMDLVLTRCDSSYAITPFLNNCPKVKELLRQAEYYKNDQKPLINLMANSLDSSEDRIEILYILGQNNGLNGKEIVSAVIEDETQVVEYLIDKYRQDPNTRFIIGDQWKTLLQYAKEKGMNDTCYVLINHGAKNFTFR